MAQLVTDVDAWYRQTMSDESATTLSPRLRRTLELAYGVEGVVAARVWQWTGRVAVGIRGASTTAPDLVSRVQSAVAGLQEAGEVWDFGILGDDPGA